MKKKSILIKEFHHKQLTTISKTFGIKYGDLVESMILYFKKTGINPLAAVNENPAAMVKVLDKRIVSFLKVQERDILKPLRNEVFEYSELQKKQYDSISGKMENLSKWVNDSVIKINRFDENRTQRISTDLKNVETQFMRQQNAILLLSEMVDSKNKTGFTGKIKTLFE